MTDVFGDEIVVFLAHHGEVGVEVRPDCVTLSLTQRRVAKIVDTTSVDVDLHRRNRIETDGFDKGATTGDSSAVRVAGGNSLNRGLRWCDLDAIISVNSLVEPWRDAQTRRCTPERGTLDVGQVTVSKLGATATTKEILAVLSAGSRPVNRSLQSFDLAAILTIGYCGPSLRGNRFCRWATRILHEHLLPLRTSREHRDPHVNAFIKVTA